MATGRKAGTKNKTWRGIPIQEYRDAKSTMRADVFERWVIKATGKPRMRNNVMGKNAFADMQRLFPEKEMSLADAKKTIDNLGKALLKEQQDHASTVKKYKSCVELCEKICADLQKERNRSWISRLFNLKG